MASCVAAITSHLHSEHKPLKISQVELPDEFWGIHISLSNL